MTKKELLKKLIAHYKKVIKLTEGKTNTEIKQIARSKHVYYGICAAAKLFNKRLSGSKWVRSHCNYHNFWWFKPVCKCRNTKQTIKALQDRVDKMKEILKTCK